MNRRNKANTKNAPPRPMRDVTTGSSNAALDSLLVVGGCVLLVMLLVGANVLLSLVGAFVRGTVWEYVGSRVGLGAFLSSPQKQLLISVSDGCVRSKVDLLSPHLSFPASLGEDIHEGAPSSSVRDVHQVTPFHIWPLL